MSNKGLGDTVEAVIKRATFGRVRPKKGCGCKKRKQWLNEKVPYNNTLLGMANKVINKK
jgi:hypothetical protein